MASKRLKKKQIKEQQYRVLQGKGYREKEIRRLPKDKRTSLYLDEVKRIKRNEKRRKEREKKRKYIEDNNLKSLSLISRWTKKQIIKKPTPDSSWNDLYKAKRKFDKDIKEQGRIQRLLHVGYEFTQIKQSDVSSDAATQRLIDKLKDYGYKVDWNKVYHSKKGIFFAFRDITGEANLSTIIRDFLKMPIAKLLEELKRIVELPLSYDEKTHSGSSGMCGQAKVYFDEDESNNHRYQFDEMSDITKFKDRIRRLKEKRKYTGSKHQTYVKYDKINDGNIHEFTLKNLIAIAVALLNNIFENDRAWFYNDFRYMITEIEPKVADYIPEKQDVY